MERTLWRLDGFSPGPRDPEQFAAGLRLHLAHADLTSVLVQIGAEQQAYVCLRGCAGCPVDRHLPGCRVALLRRLLRVAWGPVELMPVPLGLTRRPYTQVVYATPTPRSVPFAPGDLAAWSEDRVVLHWARGELPRAAALLAADDGPDLADAAQAWGWTARRLPVGIGVCLVNRPIPGTVWGGGAWTGAPVLLTPQHRHDVPVEQIGGVEKASGPVKGGA